MMCYYLNVHVQGQRVKTDHQETAWPGGGGMDWIDLGKNRYKSRALVNAVMNLQVPYNAVNFLTS